MQNDNSKKAHPPKILFVDDDPVFKRIVRIGLEKHGYDLTVASNGHEAIDQLGKQLFDLIVIDMMMPYMDGLSFLYWLRNTAKIHTPVLVQTSLARENIEAEIKEAGAQDLITKPTRLPVLIQKIRDWIH